VNMKTLTLQEIIEILKACKEFRSEKEISVGIYWIIHLPTEKVFIIDVSKENDLNYRKSLLNDIMMILKSGD